MKLFIIITPVALTSAWWIIIDFGIFEVATCNLLFLFLFGVINFTTLLSFCFLLLVERVLCSFVFFFFLLPTSSWSLIFGCFFSSLSSSSSLLLLVSSSRSASGALFWWLMTTISYVMSIIVHKTRKKKNYKTFLQRNEKCPTRIAGLPANLPNA